jgi:hypothetical protein
MCQPISGILTKDHVFFGATDSHEDIIRQHKLHEGRGRVNFVRFEITPPDDDPSKPLKEWQYQVDQDSTPKWYDASDEKRARTALKVSKLAPLDAGYQAKRAKITTRSW